MASISQVHFKFASREEALLTVVTTDTRFGYEIRNITQALKNTGKSQTN